MILFGYETIEYILKQHINLPYYILFEEGVQANLYQISHQLCSNIASSQKIPSLCIQK